MPTNHALQNTSDLPVGAQTVRHALVLHPDGIVRQHSTFYQDGQFKTVSKPIDTVNRGVLIPAWKLPVSSLRRRVPISTGPGMTPVLGGGPTIERNTFGQTAASAPVGTLGRLQVPLPNAAKQGRLYGAPANVPKTSTV